MKTKTPPPSFTVGEQVTYHPRRKRAGAYPFHDATVIGLSKTGRPQIEFAVSLIRRVVSPRSLTRQQRLPI